MVGTRWMPRIFNVSMSERNPNVHVESWAHLSCNIVFSPRTSVFFYKRPWIPQLAFNSLHSQQDYYSSFHTHIILSVRCTLLVAQFALLPVSPGHKAASSAEEVPSLGLAKKFFKVAAHRNPLHKS